MEFYLAPRLTVSGLRPRALSISMVLKRGRQTYSKRSATAPSRKRSQSVENSECCEETALSCWQIGDKSRRQECLPLFSGLPESVRMVPSGRANWRDGASPDQSALPHNYLMIRRFAGAVGIVRAGEAASVYRNNDHTGLSHVPPWNTNTS
jgi:hypothetical protein